MQQRNTNTKCFYKTNRPQLLLLRRQIISDHTHGSSEIQQLNMKFTEDEHKYNHHIAHCHYWISIKKIPPPQNLCTTWTPVILICSS